MWHHKLIIFGETSLERHPLRVLIEASVRLNGPRKEEPKNCSEPIYTHDLGDEDWETGRGYNKSGVKV